MHADMVTPGSRPAGGEIFFSCKRDSIFLPTFPLLKAFHYHSDGCDWTIVKKDVYTSYSETTNATDNNKRS